MERNPAEQNRPWIMAIDAGGSGLRAAAVGRDGKIFKLLHRSHAPLPGKDGTVEHDPEALWESVAAVCGDLTREPGISTPPTAIGITVQRATFLLFDPVAGRAVTNLVSWSDVRAAGTAEAMNRNILWRVIRFGVGVLAKLTGSAFFRTASMLRFTTVHVSCRLKYVLDSNPDLRNQCRDGRLRLATLDTWLLYRMTGKTVWATDRSNAAATSLYNPFDLKWNSLFCRLFGIPMGILPPVKDTVDDFGFTDPGSFCGLKSPIYALAGDQMAALFGHRCFDPGEVKVSKGSGGFVTINVGKKPRFSPRGLFPLIAWSIRGEVTYMLEGQVASVGTLIDWLSRTLGFASTPEELDALVEATPDSGGVVFLPTPLGIRFPYFRSRMRCAVFGLGLETSKGETARAMYEGIAFRIREIIRGIEKDLKVSVKQMKVDGGVSRSAILVRLISAACGIPVLRAPEPELSSIGAALLAGIGAGWWRGEDDLRSIPEEYEIFSSPREEEYMEQQYRRWKKAVHLAHRFSSGL